MTTNNKTFAANNGSYQVWTAPATLIGSGAIELTLIGAKGSPAQGAGHPGGAGGQLYSGVQIAAGDTLYFYVGLSGAISGGGWGWVDSSTLSGGTSGGDGGNVIGHSSVSNGGGGGGASAVYDDTTTTLLAGAGGGGGGGSGGFPGNKGEPPDHNTGQGGFGGGAPQDGYDGWGGKYGSGGALGVGGAAGTGGSGSGGDSAGAASTANVGGDGGYGTSYGGCGGGGGGGVGHGSGTSGGGSGGGGADGSGTAGAALGGGGGGSGGASYLNPSTALGIPNWSEGINVFGAPASGDGSITLAWTQADPPLVPTPETPASLSTPPTPYTNITPCSWQFNAGVDSGDQAAYQWRVQTFGGPWQYYDAAGSGSLTSTPTWNTSSVEGFSLPAGLLPNNGAYVWEVRTYGNALSPTIILANNLFSPWSQPSIFMTPAAPTCQITAPRGLTAILQPTISWTEVLTDGPQDGWRALIYPFATTQAASFLPGDAGALYDSTLTAGAALYVVTSGVTYVTGNQYVAYVQITQSDAAVSNWASSVFTAQATTPKNPGIAVFDPDGSMSAVNIVVWGLDNNDLAGQQTVEVEFSMDGGVTWSDVTPTIPAITMPGQMLTVNQPAFYDNSWSWRARVKSPASGTPTSGWTRYYAHPIILGAKDAYLSDSASGAVIPLWIEKSSPLERPIEQGIFTAVGNQSPIVVSDVRRARGGEMSVISQNDYHRDALIAVLTPPRQVTVTRQANDPSYPGFIMKVLPTASVDEDKVGHYWFTTPRVLTFHFLEQA